MRGCVDLVEWANKAARGRQIRPEHLVAEALLRCYAELVDGKVTGWVPIVDLGEINGCAGMYVEEEYRRRIAWALMAKMLRDDRKRVSQATGGRCSICTCAIARSARSDPYAAVALGHSGGV
ncbi:MAG: hypothetical protein QGH25_07330 [Candidatus Latescibacteria bacterium]|nr:hypothetical protein [Candidatus Latescibacterota bacterium]